jgi:acyl carrier protein
MTPQSTNVTELAEGLDGELVGELTGGAPTDGAGARHQASREGILAELRTMLTDVIGEDYLLDVEISPATMFNDDLGIESVEFVQLSVMLQERYGTRVDFVSFIADLGIEEIMSLTVGQLVDFIGSCLEVGVSEVGVSEVGVSHG